MLLGSMADESFSTTTVVPPRCPTVLTGMDLSQNLIVLNVNAQAPLKLTTTNYPTWQLQFTSLIFEYDLFGFINGPKSCHLAMITLPNAASPSPNLDHILWLKQDQLLLNAIVDPFFPPSAVHLYLRCISCYLNNSRKDVCLSFVRSDHDSSPESCQSLLR